MASELYVETLKGLTSGDNANKVIIPSGQTLDASAGGFIGATGQVLQTSQGVYSGVGSITAEQWVTIKSVDITFQGGSSSLLISAVIPFGSAGAEPMHLRLTVDGTVVGAGTQAGSNRQSSTSSAAIVSSNRMVMLMGQYLHSTTYTAGQTKTVAMQVYGGASTTYYVNRTDGDSDTAFYPRTISTLTVQEIAG